MKEVNQRRKRQVSALLLSVALVLMVAGLLLWSPGAASHAQQGRDRQLVQGDSSQAKAGKRIALVIGNGAYTNAPPLKNPVNDARDMADELSRLGFEVEHGADLNQKQMKFMIRQFGQKLKAGGQGVFYYAGHGVQSKGHNYLIPVDAVIESEADIEDQGVDVQLMLNYMDDAQNGLNIVILDACRNNPFARSMRSAESGLAQVDAPTGTLIAYATAPGRVASDGPGRNGLYTSELLKQMKVPGLSVTDMFMRVRAEVVKETAGKQVPWEASSLIGSFSFNATTSSTTNAANNASNTRSKPSVALEDAGTVEAEYWETIKNSTGAADYEAYLKEYPQGRYAQLARLKLRQLEAAKSNRNNSAMNVNQPMGRIEQPTQRLSGQIDELADISKAVRAPRVGTIVRNQMGMELVYIPAGTFMMGSDKDDSEKPIHQVTIREGFYMGRYEVTQAQWQQVMGSNPSHFKGENNPVETISWDDAMAFINKLNEMNDVYKYRLPTEAEWEYACRAGTTGDYAGDLDEMGWYADNSGKTTHPVGQKQPNAFGLYDMHGNVWEWCRDYGHPNYNGAPTDGSAWLSGGEQRYRELRGGSWDSSGLVLRSATRVVSTPDHRNAGIGFRLVAVART